MSRRYFLHSSGVHEDEVNWLEEFETWRQRCRHSVLWHLQREGNQGFVAQVEREQVNELKKTLTNASRHELHTVNGKLISHVKGVGSSPRSAKIDAIIRLDNADPPILVGPSSLAYEEAAD